MTISIRLGIDDEKLVKAYARSKNITVSDLVRSTVLEKIEDEYDLGIYKMALCEYESHPETFSLEEVREHCELDD